MQQDSERKDTTPNCFGVIHGSMATDSIPISIDGLEMEFDSRYSLSGRESCRRLVSVRNCSPRSVSA